MSTAVAARDSEVIDFHGSGPSARARLCAFETGKAKLLPAHEAWLKQHIVPLLSKGGPVCIRLWGFASKLGSAAFNQKLSLDRAREVKRFLEQHARGSSACLHVGGYGESLSMGAANDNSPLYRAVDIYVYPSADPPPPPVNPPTVTCSGPIYMGFGVKFGGMLAVGGVQTIEGYMYSSEDYNDSFVVEAMVGTLGVGLGAGANLVLLLGYGASSYTGFLNARFEGWDFAVSLGGRWGDVLKGLKKVPALARMATALKSGKLTSKGVKALTKLNKDEWEAMTDLADTILDALDVDPCVKTPTINSFDVPLAGIALEVSLYKWWARVTSVY